jgi:TolA-binding protein
MLARLDRRSDAVQFLQRDVILSLPPQDRAGRDEFDFLVGLISGARSTAGRASLFRLLATGVKAERQRQALQLLADASTSEPERGQFRAELNRHLAASAPHPIRETLLYFRGQLAVSERDFAQAEEDANTLLREFPGSPLRAHAHGVLTQSAWSAGRYRLAADCARRAREALPLGTDSAFTRFELRVLEAEAWFRAGLQNPLQGGVDFRYAADAYEAVLRERPEDLRPGTMGPLMFQRVLAEIKAGSNDAAEVLDRLARDPAFDPENRWQAEWSVARAMQVKGNAEAAFNRAAKGVSMLASTGSALPADLRVRMAWLQARLAFDTRRFRDTLTLVETLVADTRPLDPVLRGEIVSAGGLLKGRALFALGEEAAALTTLKLLRDTYPRSDAAIYSYLTESAHFESRGNLVAAQLRLNELINNPDYSRSDYLPYALFQTALLSERLGGEDNLNAALRRIEDLVNIPTAAAQDLVFRARLKQGDLLRRRNQFPQAQQAYEELINKFPQRPDVVLAQLALAECLNARSAAEPAYAEIARLKFEELRDRLDAPADVRVEAGYNLGKLLERSGRLDEAATVWWRDVVVPFLQEAAPAGADARRPYWLARTLLDYAALSESRGRLDEAREAYQLIVTAKLGAAEGLARQSLERLGTRPRS